MCIKTHNNLSDGTNFYFIFLFNGHLRSMTYFGTFSEQSDPTHTSNETDNITPRHTVRFETETHACRVEVGHNDGRSTVVDQLHAVSIMHGLGTCGKAYAKSRSRSCVFIDSDVRNGQNDINNNVCA